MVRDPDARLDAAAGRLSGYARRRLAGEPVSRILGRREFWGLPFIVTPDVLDPRPDTEGLVGALIDAMGGSRGPLDILDLGTGSGAILAALLSSLPDARGVGIDRSPNACGVARRNLAALGLSNRASIVCCSWADSLSTTVDIVACNPPYVRSGDLLALPADVRDHDPIAALDGGHDGLAAYRAILPRLASLLRREGIAAFECGFDQGDSVAALMRDAGFDGVTVLKDLAGHGRVVLGTLADRVQGSG